jgi:translation initiation factor IF-3
MEGLKKAQGLGLDLVEISAKSDPPICKIINYSKFLYDQKKKQKEIKSKTAKVIMKGQYARKGESQNRGPLGKIKGGICYLNR